MWPKYVCGGQMRVGGAHMPSLHTCAQSYTEHGGSQVWECEPWSYSDAICAARLNNIQQRVMWKMRAINQRYALHTVNHHESSTAPWRQENIGISGAIKTWVWQWHQWVFCLCKHTCAWAATQHKSLLRLWELRDLNHSPPFHFTLKVLIHNLIFGQLLRVSGTPGHTPRLTVCVRFADVCVDLYSEQGSGPFLYLPDRRRVRGPQRTAEKPGSQIHNAFPDFPYGSNYHDALYSSRVGWVGYRRH